MARKIKKSAGEIKSRWQLMRRGRIALGLGALLIAGLLASVALADTGVPGITSSGSTDTTAAATDTTTTPPPSTDTTTTTTPATTTAPSSPLTPVISSDKSDYSPGSTVTLTGTGWG